MGGRNVVLSQGLALPMFFALTPTLISFAVLMFLLNRRARERDRMIRRDPLTGLGNRVQLAETFDRWMREVASPGSDEFAMGPAMLLVDLDGFKDVNDTLGHTAGDIVLIQVADLLVAVAGPKATVIRLGGDEFAICYPKPLTMDFATNEAKRILAILSATGFSALGVQLDVRASIGVALAPFDGTTFSELMQHADVAMYSAKRTRSGVERYDATTDTNSTDRLAMLGMLRDAMDDGHMRLYYQPVIRATDTSLVGFEALIRWEHPTRGLIYPADFIPLVERTSLVHALTRWVLLTACRQAARWRQDGLDLTVAVNISPVALEEGLLGIVEEALVLSRLDARHLVLEVTESAVSDNPVQATKVVGALRDRGIEVSIDDFGAGFTSLGQLRGLPVQQLKIDRQFIVDLEEHDDDTIIASIIDLGHRLGLTVVAEGVESELSAQRLVELRCDELQGFHFARAMPADQVSGWIKRRDAERDLLAAALRR
jgi:diguanylate cyclase (GGDEF)-like protein